jgi:hypothetical protein
MRLLIAGNDVTVIALWLGHEQISTTMPSGVQQHGFHESSLGWVDVVLRFEALAARREVALRADRMVKR